MGDVCEEGEEVSELYEMSVQKLTEKVEQLKEQLAAKDAELERVRSAAVKATAVIRNNSKYATFQMIEAGLELEAALASPAAPEASAVKPRLFDRGRHVRLDEVEALVASPAAEPALARHQTCGCVICICDNDEQCQGCGAKTCGTHPVGAIPNPVYAQPAPTTEPKYRLLIAGDVIQADDEFLEDDCKTWSPIANKLGKGGPYSPGFFKPIRRRQETQPAPVAQPATDTDVGTKAQQLDIEDQIGGGE